MIEAEEWLKELPDHQDADDTFHRLMMVVTKSEEAARKALYHRIRARKWRQTEGKSW